MLLRQAALYRRHDTKPGRRGNPPLANRRRVGGVLLLLQGLAKLGPLHRHHDQDDHAGDKRAEPHAKEPEQRTHNFLARVTSQRNLPAACSRRHHHLVLARSGKFTEP